MNQRAKIDVKHSTCPHDCPSACALDIEVLVATPERFDYNVRRCRYAETYKAMGLGKIGHLLSCNRDAVFCQGYNPAIALKRTQTIMQGAAYCDFRYRFK